MPRKAPSLSPLRRRSPPNRNDSVPSAPIRGNGGRSVVSESMRIDAGAVAEQGDLARQVDAHRAPGLAANQHAAGHGARAGRAGRARQARDAVGRQGERARCPRRRTRPCRNRAAFPLAGGAGRRARVEACRKARRCTSGTARRRCPAREPRRARPAPAAASATDRTRRRQGPDMAATLAGRCFNRVNAGFHERMMETDMDQAKQGRMARDAERRTVSRAARGRDRSRPGSGALLHNKAERHLSLRRLRRALVRQRHQI